MPLAAPGHFTVLSCQHALGMGPIAGENAVRDPLGRPLLRYEQPDYVTYLDLGDASAVATEGWNREPRLTGSDAKAVKKRVNTKWIYPPRGTRQDVLEAHKPRATTDRSGAALGVAPAARLRRAAPPC